MTDFPTQLQSPSRPATPAPLLRFPATLLKHLFRSRRRVPIDPRYASEHLLKDIGFHRTQSVRPISSLDRLW